MSNAQKTPASRTLPKFVQHVAVSEIAQRFLGLPGSVAAVNGPTVTVKFENPNIQQIAMPVAESQYVQFPIQIGDLGVALTAAAYLGLVSGFGTGSQAATALQPNLSALIWFPVSNINWNAIDGAGGAVGIDASVVTTDNVVVGNGASGTFSSSDGQTIDVQDGIIINIY